MRPSSRVVRGRVFDVWWVVLKHLLCGAKLALPSFFKVLAYVSTSGSSDNARSDTTILQASQAVMRCSKNSGSSPGQDKQAGAERAAQP